MSNKVIGIDLGTTNSCVSVVENGIPKIITNNEGGRTTPSIVAFLNADESEKVVGTVAKRQATTNAENTFYATKRFIGKKHSEVKNDSFPFSVVASSNGDAWVKTKNNKSLSPSEIGASILQYMKEIAEKYLNTGVTKAIITVPAYFNDSQRQATKDAGKIAGLEVLRIINEPTAAALAYGLDKKNKKGTVAVFDLGGGTFDVSILDIQEGVFEVLSTNGDTHLGGEDFDDALINHMIKDFKIKEGIDLSSDKTAIQRFKEAAENAKIALSSSLNTSISLPFITANASGAKHYNTEISRSQFESMTQHLIEKTKQPCLQALKDSQKTPEEINYVILVGGMTRMPKIRDFIKEIFKQEPCLDVNPDEAVAMGAAVQGAIISGEVKDLLLLDVTPLSLGIETLGGVFTPIIPKNTTIPTKKSQVFSTAEDNQTSVTIRAFQGERKIALDNRLLGQFELFGIPQAPRGIPQIEVTFDIDADGITHVSAKDTKTGKEQKIKIQSSSGLSEEEIERMKNDADKMAEEDEKRLKLIEIRNKLEGSIYSAEKSLKDGNYAEDIKTSVQNKINSSRELLGSDDRDALEKAYEELTQELSKLYEATASQESNNTNQEKSSTDGGEAKTEDSE